MLPITPLPGVSLCGVEDPTLPGAARALLEWASGAGFRAVAIDAAMPETRPRELDRSARRGLAATLRRLELAFAGFDLWIPPAHFADPARADRALAAARAALEGAAEIADLAGGRPLVSMVLVDDAAPSLLTELDREASRVGAVVADHAWPPIDRGEARAALRVGLDPAAALAAGADPALELPRMIDQLAVARLSDMDASGRVPPGNGRLEIDAYLAGLSLAPGGSPVVLDLRGVRRQAEAATATIERLGASRL